MFYGKRFAVSDSQKRRLKSAITLCKHLLKRRLKPAATFALGISIWRLYVASINK